MFISLVLNWPVRDGGALLTKQHYFLYINYGNNYSMAFSVVLDCTPPIKYLQFLLSFKNEGKDEEEEEQYCD